MMHLFCQLKKEFRAGVIFYLVLWNCKNDSKKVKPI
jgi:hypothetical protein